MCNFIKIGKWKGALCDLSTRYHTYYGKRIQVLAYPVKGDYSAIEGEIKSKLDTYTIDPRCELVKKTLLRALQGNL